jgi:hypothetical protein
VRQFGKEGKQMKESAILAPAAATGPAFESKIYAALCRANRQTVLIQRLP